MASLDIRAEIAARNDEVSTPTVEVTKVPDEVKVDEPSAKNTEPSIESPGAVEGEPDESQYEDRAEFKKALKEWTRKEAEKELREAHKRETDGYYADLRKQREQKRVLKQQLQDVTARYQAAVPTTIQAPDINIYTDPQHYAEDYANWKINTGKLESQKQTVQATQAQAETQEIEEIFRHNAKMSGMDTKADQIVEHVAKSGILNEYTNEARKSILLSPIGTNLLEFLSMHPEIAEEIADSGSQIRELKLLETSLTKAIYSQNQVTAPEVVKATEVTKPAVVSPKITPPSKVSGSGSTKGNTGKLSDAKSMDEYMRLRTAEKKRR